MRTVWLKDDTRNPTLSFKDRVVAMAAARAVEFGFDTLACASTGNLAGATAAAAAAAGLRSVVFIPADLEPAKVAHALAYGATVVPVRGHVRPGQPPLAWRSPTRCRWAFVNVNLRPFYAEGSKTLAFEIAEELGWRLPDVIVAPLASGSLYVKTGKAVRRAGRGRPGRGRGRCASSAASRTAARRSPAPSGPARRSSSRSASRTRSSGRWPSATRRTGRYALELARESGGSLESVPDSATAAAIRLVAETEGIYTETAGGVTVAALQQAIARGVVRPTDEVVVLLTGNGLKTPDARSFGQPGRWHPGGAPVARPIRPGEPGLARPLAASMSAFEAWFEG